jgi:serine/threonine protein kinase
VHIGRYEVVRELKGGGMGSVTLCRAPAGDLVVLKRPYSTEPDAAVRLRDEARLGARLVHPGLVDTLDHFEHEGRPVLVVAYVDGLSLEIMRRVGPMPVPVVARIGRVIADALDAIHNAEDERGRPMHILHRDVTPGNILLNREGYAKLIDLGIARFSEREAEVTQDGFLRGTMRYLAPELLEGGAYSTATDLWALGMVLWEAALGRFAYRGETDREVLAGIVMGRPMKLAEDEHIDEDLKAAIEPLLQRLPVIRTNDAAEAAARFAAVFFNDTATTEITRETLEEFFQNKEPSVELPVLGPGGGLGNRPYLGETGFEDVATHAENEQHDLENEEELYLEDEEPTLARGAPPPADALPVSPVRMDVDNEQTYPLGDEADPLAPQATVAVPAPIDFDPATGLPRAPVAQPPAEDDWDEDIDDEATITDLRSPLAPPPADDLDAPDSDTAQQIAAVRDALLALDSLNDGAPVPDEKHPSFADDGADERTLSVSSPLPAEAFRSDIAAHADGFEEGVSVEAATAAPAPQLDDQDFEDMHTLDGLRPARDDGPIEVTLRTPAPKRATARPPTGFEDDEEPTESQRVARVGLVRKTAAQIAAERAAKPPPTPGVSSRPPVDIDALPSARPKPREEHVEELDALSPFSGPTEVVAPTHALLDGARPSIDVPNLEIRDPTEVETGRFKKSRPAAEVAEAKELEEDVEPTALDLRVQADFPPAGDEPEVQPGDSPGELRMDTAVGAKFSEMPAPPSPVQPSAALRELQPLGPFAATEAFADDEADGTEPAKKEEPKFTGGETVSLGEMASLLDDD